MSRTKTSDFQLHEDIRCVGGESDDQEPDGPLSTGQQARVEALSQCQVAAADDALMSAAAPHWQKVARLVAERATGLTNRAGLRMFTTPSAWICWFRKASWKRMET